MKEAKLHSQTEEFIRATQDLHGEGQAWLYMHDISAQMARNDEALMRRHGVASKVLGLIGVQLGEPQKAPGALYPASYRLENQGRLRSDWEASPSTGRPGLPRRRVYQLIEEPEL